MRFGITSCLVCVLSQQLLVSAKAPNVSKLDELDTYTYEQYILDFGKVYKNKDEYQQRKEIFEKRMKDILNHNEAYYNKRGVPDSPGYFMNANQFTDLKDSEIHNGYDKSQLHAWADQAVTTTSMNRDLSSGEVYKYKMKLPFTCDDVSTLPKQVDWRTKHPSVVTPVKNQMQCGSCWAFGSVSALETQIAIKTHKLHSLSEEEPLSCARNPDHCGGKGGCTGATAEIAYEYISKHGINSESTFPYNASIEKQICPKEDNKQLRGFVNDAVKYSMKGFSVLPGNDEKCLMNALAKHGSVTVAVAAKKFQFYGGGIYDESNGDNMDIDHLVTVEGYGTDEGVDYWIVRNSWGANWGENGYIRIKRDNTCGVDKTPLNGIHCEYKPGGKINPVNPVKVCGIAGVQFHAVIPLV